MKIEKIQKIGHKYKITFDDQSKMATFDDVIINNGLLFNKEVNKELLNKLNIDNNYYDIYYKTINYITKKLRSEKEVNEYIDKFNINLKNKSEVIDKLKSIGLINDASFIKAYINDKINLNNDGPYKIKKELLMHDISEDIIDLYINKIDNTLITNKLEKLIIKKTKNSNYAGYKLKQKVVGELVNLGYKSDDIYNIYDNVNITSNINYEYDKLYKKLSLKYSGDILKNKLKQKLYQKGYSSEEINEKNG